MIRYTKFNYIVILLLSIFIIGCSSKKKISNNPPLLINHANQLLIGELENTLFIGEKIELKGYNINFKDSVISQLNVIVKDISRMPFDNELLGLGKKISTIAKTILIDTNQYKHYKVTFIDNINRNEKSIILSADSITSIPLASSRFKEGYLKR